MTDDIRGWLTNLAPTNKQRLIIVKDMLRHANEDQMNPDDRDICQQILAGKITAPEVAPPMYVKIDEEADGV